MSKKRNPAITRYPSPIAENRSQRSSEEKIELIADHFHSIMEILGLDMDDESLKKTPGRVAEMFVNEVFSGLSLDTFPDAHLIDEDSSSEVGHHSLILTKCGVMTFCEHHFVPVTGYAFVGYIPRGRVIGLSKIHRIVRYFSHRPQLQERLTAQIADSLSIILGHDDVAVSIQAQHYCVMMRGVRDENGITSTSYFGGAFKNDPSKQDEFFHALQRTVSNVAFSTR
ncbi:MAG TPA: GTP cyclohydrolase I FolE [Chlamydiales bacterium]|nr:GTP cyclohydrolase I FolE [Chlamydiales bacterium]